MTPEGPPLSIAELAKELNCCRHPVDNAVKDGTIPAVRVGHRYFIPRRIAYEILTNGRIPDPAEQTPKSDLQELAVASAG